MQHFSRLASTLLFLLSASGLLALGVDLNNPGTNLTFAAPATVAVRGEIPTGDIQAVSFRLNGVESPSDDPTTVTLHHASWDNLPEGRYTVTLNYTTSAGAASTMPVVFEVGLPPRDCLMLTLDVALGAGDTATKARLESLGYRCTVMAARLSTAADAANRDLVFISESVSSNQIAAKFRDVAVPVLCSEDYNYDDFQMTGPTIDTHYGFLPGQTQLTIPDPPTVLSGGLTTGTLTIFTATGRTQWGIPNGNAIVGATIPGSPDRAASFGYPRGAAMAGGLNAPARRTGFFLQVFTQEMTLMTPAGLALFDAAVRWTGSERELAGLPAAPTGLRLEEGGMLSWQDNAANEDGFELEQSADGTVYTPRCRFAAETTGAWETQTPAAYYRLRAFNGDGFSEWTATSAPPTGPEEWQVK